MSGGEAPVAERARSVNDVDEFLAALPDQNLLPTWKILAHEVPVTPAAATVPHLWEWSAVRPLLERAGALVSAEEAERRTLAFCNPGHPGRGQAVATIFADVQLVLPGEHTDTHRHTPSAIRFMMQGEGSYALAGGEKLDQFKGDLVLGPAWAWHAHCNEGTEPTIWFDALDAPLVRMLDASFFEPYGHDSMPIDKALNASVHTYGAAAMLPTWGRQAPVSSPLIKYPWAQAHAALMEADDGCIGPHDDVLFEYVNPATGGPCMPTMACYLQRLRPGRRTAPHRHTSSTVYLGVSGHGRIVIDGTGFDWGYGDVIALPSWAEHAHENLSADEDAILFSVSDRPTLEKLMLYREDA